MPIMVRWPGVAKPGSESRVPWAFWDFFPTACDIAGARAPEGLDGRSVAPLLRGEAFDAERPLYWEFFPFDFENQRYRLNAMQQAVRLGTWKAVRPKPGAPLELCNLEADPSEANNVAATNPEVVARMEQVLREQHTEPRKPDGPLSLRFGTSAAE